MKDKLVTFQFCSCAILYQFCSGDKAKNVVGRHDLMQVTLVTFHYRSCAILPHFCSGDNDKNVVEKHTVM